MNRRYGGSEQYGGSIEHSGSQNYYIENFPNTKNFTSEFSLTSSEFHDSEYEYGGSFIVDTAKLFGGKIRNFYPHGLTKKQVLFSVEFMIAVKESNLEQLNRLLESEKNLFKASNHFTFDNGTSNISFLSYLLKFGNPEFIKELTKGSNPILTKECFFDENLYNERFANTKEYKNFEFLSKKAELISEENFSNKLNFDQAPKDHIGIYPSFLFPNCENFTSEFSLKQGDYHEARGGHYSGSFTVPLKSLFGGKINNLDTMSLPFSSQQVLFCAEFIIAVKENDPNRLNKLLKSEENLFKTPNRFRLDRSDDEMSFLSYLLKHGKFSFINSLTKGSNPLLTKECFYDLNLSNKKIVDFNEYRNFKFLSENTDLLSAETYFKKLGPNSLAWNEFDRKVYHLNNRLESTQEKNKLLRHENTSIKEKMKEMEERMKNMEKLLMQMQTLSAKQEQKKTSGLGKGGKL